MQVIKNPVRKKFALDYSLLIIIVLMCVVNLLAVYCAIPLTTSGSMKVLYKQIIWVVLGFVLLAFLLYFGIDRLYTGVSVFYWILMVLLALLIVDKYIDLPFIRPVSGGRCWIQFGSLASIQPSEFMKVILIIQIADITHKHNQEKTDNSVFNDLKLFGKVLLRAVPPLILILFEPDTGLPLIIVVSLSLIVMVSGIKHYWIILYFFLVGGVIFGAIYLFYNNPNLLARILGDSYKLNRFYGWLETESYISSYGNQLYQSLLAVGSSGIFGYGIQSVVVYFAEPQNDFIFAVIAQNFGFIGTAFVIILCTLFDLKLLDIALKYKDNRGRYLVVGVVGMLIFQQFENIGMIIGITPITGITLPFISSGGSSLLSYMIPLAIIFHMSSENKINNEH